MILPQHGQRLETLVWAKLTNLGIMNWQRGQATEPTFIHLIQHWQRLDLGTFMRTPKVAFHTLTPHTAAHTYQQTVTCK
jgi:hypothetical protein